MFEGALTLCLFAYYHSKAQSFTPPVFHWSGLRLRRAQEGLSRVPSTSDTMLLYNPDIALPHDETTLTLLDVSLISMSEVIIFPLTFGWLWTLSSCSYAHVPHQISMPASIIRNVHFSLCSCMSNCAMPNNMSNNHAKAKELHCA